MIMIPTLFGITLVYFVIINMAPGSPVEQKIQQMRFSGMGGAGATDASSSKENAISEEVVEALKKQYGFDKPLHIRYWIWLKNLSRLDFGESFTYEEPAIDIIVSKFPVSMQFGIISLFMSYLICIPLGIFKAIKHGSAFDLGSSVLLSALYSIPGFMLAILLLVFFAGGNFLEWFPLGSLLSDNYDSLTFFGKIKDRIWHFVLPLCAYMVGNFTVLTILMKNSLLDEIKKDYVRTARAKGVSEKVVYLKHAARNALIPIVTGLGSFLSFFLAGSLLIETIFELDGIGLMGYGAVLQRDYNILMALLFIQSFLMLLGNLISDLAYIVVDPRIDFS
jgi:microcin C transport system permease protein